MVKVKTKLTDQGVFQIVLNRPEKYNAIDFDVIKQLKECLLQIKFDPQIKIVTITGSGDKAFCSGGDLTAFHQLRSAEEAYEMLSLMGEVLYELTTLSKPTVALVNGIAIGGGCEILTACDFRLCSDHAQLGFIQASLGITTGWGGGSLLLERLNQDQALSLLMQGEKMEARDALRIGLVTEIYKKDEFIHKTEEWLLKLTLKTSDVLTAYKKMALKKMDTTRLLERMEIEIKECSLLWESDDHHNAVERFFTK